MTTTADFPVVWDDPRDAEITWQQDGMHSSEPATPLGSSFAGLISHGFTKAFAEYSVPAVFRSMVVNHWMYNSLVPQDLPPEELERMMGDVQARIGGAIAQIGTLWDDQFLPEIKALLRPAEEADLPAMSIDELLVHWELTKATAERLMEIHFLAIIPAYVSVSEYDELYRAALGGGDPHASYRLLQGLGNLTVDTGIALWDLSRKAMERPEVRKVIEDRGGLDALRSVDGGHEFITALNEYLETYGHRGDKWDIAYPSWVEDPTPVFEQLKDCFVQDKHPAVELQRAASERDRLIQETRERIADEGQRGAFDFLLAAAEKGIQITEDHNFWIDCRGMYQLRRVCVEIGKRLADAGVIEAADDVFFLEMNEIGETLLALPTIDRKDLIAERKVSVERARSITPPPFVGSPPTDEGPSNPIELAFGKFFGGPPPEASDDGILRGHPGSPGVVRGTARIITSIADAERLEPGDVLVAPATAPPWTPLFAFAGAVVTDVGGIISHCAVVAREYQIPAVVGCGNATKAIKDGQVIEVDGTQGTVRVVV